MRKEAGMPRVGGAADASAGACGSACGGRAAGAALDGGPRPHGLVGDAAAGAGRPSVADADCCGPGDAGRDPRALRRFAPSTRGAEAQSVLVVITEGDALDGLDAGFDLPDGGQPAKKNRAEGYMTR